MFGSWERKLCNMVIKFDRVQWNTCGVEDEAWESRNEDLQRNHPNLFSDSV